MKAEKLIKLSIDYEHIDISPNWVAFSISRTLENTHTISGITHRDNWNLFLEDPFSIIPSKKILNDKLVLLKEDNFSQLSVFKNVLEKNFDFLEIDDNDFSYSSYQQHPDYSVYRLNYISHKTYDVRNNCGEFYYLSDLDNQVIYFELKIDLPYLTETKANEALFKNLLDLSKNFEGMEIIASNKTLHPEKYDLIQSFENVIDSINDPYIANFNDFCAPSPEFTESIGTLKFNLPGFTQFNDFFELTKKYVTLDSFDITEQKMGLILTLAVLHSQLNTMIHEDLFNLFPEEYKIAQCISLEHKLKPKDIHIKKMKI